MVPCSTFRILSCPCQLTVLPIRSAQMRGAAPGWIESQPRSHTQPGTAASSLTISNMHRLVNRPVRTSHQFGTACQLSAVGPTRFDSDGSSVDSPREVVLRQEAKPETAPFFGVRVPILTGNWRRKSLGWGLTRRRSGPNPSGPNPSWPQPVNAQKVWPQPVGPQPVVPNPSSCFHSSESRT